jgi:hypothetical protein
MSQASAERHKQGQRMFKSARGNLLMYLFQKACFSAGDISFNSNVIRSVCFDSLSGAFMFMIEDPARTRHSGQER